MGNSFCKFLPILSLVCILMTTSCNDGNLLCFTQETRDPERPLTVHLRQVDESDLELRSEIYVGALEVDRQSPVDLIDDLSLCQNAKFALHALRFYPIKNLNSSETSYALSSAITLADWKHKIFSFAPTSLPLILQHQEPNWYYTNRERFDEKHLIFDHFLSRVSNKIDALDLRYFRVPSTHKNSFKDFEKVTTMTMPVFARGQLLKEFHYPPNLNDLTVYNSVINSFLSENAYGLGELKVLRLYGCWIDEDFSYVPTEYLSRSEVKSVSSLIPFKKISRQIEKLEIVDCDDRTFDALLYLPWDNFKSLSIIRSFYYPVQDGEVTFESLCFNLLGSNIEKFPKLDTIIIGSYDMETAIDQYHNGELARIPNWIVKIEKIKAAAQMDIKFELKGLKGSNVDGMRS